MNIDGTDEMPPLETPTEITEEEEEEEQFEDGDDIIALSGHSHNDVELDINTDIKY